MRRGASPAGLGLASLAWPVSFLFFFFSFYLFFSFLSPLSPFYLLLLLSISLFSLRSPFQKNSNSFSREKQISFCKTIAHQPSQQTFSKPTYTLTRSLLLLQDCHVTGPCILYFIINTNTRTLPLPRHPLQGIPIFHLVIVASRNPH